MLSLNAFAYVNTGTAGSPVWVAQTWLINVKLPFKFDKADSSTRGTGGTKTNEAALLDPTCSVTGLWLPADAQFAARLTDAANRTAREFAIADQAIANTGCKYVRMYATWFSFEEGQELDNNITVDAELGPSNPLGTSFAAPTLNTT